MATPDVCPDPSSWVYLREPLTVMFGALLLAVGNRMGHQQTLKTVNGTIAEVIGKIPEPRLPDSRTRKGDKES